MTENEKKTVLSTFLFYGIDNTEDVELGNPVKFNKGEIIYSNENFKKALGVVLDGMCRAFPVGNSITVLSDFGKGDIFGAAAMFGSEDNYISVIKAAADCSVLFLTEEDLTELFKQNPQFAVNYIAFLSSKIRLLNQKISIYTKSGVCEKIYKYFSDHSDKDGKVVLPVNMSMLAKQLGIGRTSLYREIRCLESKKMIKKENGSFYIIKLREDNF